MVNFKCFHPFRYLGENQMVLFVEIEKEVNAAKEYLKQIEEEAMEMADRLKLDGQRRVGLESKFKNAYSALDKTVEQPLKEAKVDSKMGIKKLA